MIAVFQAAIVVFGGAAHAQLKFNSPPLKLNVATSGTFGEVRGSHFHSGLDLKTEGKTGQPVHAVWEGTVARIKVEADGFGKAIYINHPNGLTTVYAHLWHFSPEIDNFVIDQQYAKQSFTVDLTVPEGKFKVRAGQVIAFSGNTGRSGGPHLHFEVRGPNDSYLINPQQFGLMVPDTVPPTLTSVVVYPHGNESIVEGSKTKRRYEVIRAGQGNFALKAPVVRAAGMLSVGLGNFDRLSSGDNKCGARTMKVEVDGKMIYHHAIDTLRFETNRGVLAHIDPALREAADEVIERSYIAPNNPIGIYKIKEGAGMFMVRAGQRKVVKITLTDLAGNTSTIEFTVVGIHPKNHYPTKVAPLAVFYPTTEGKFKNDQLSIVAPVGSLTDTLALSFTPETACKTCIGPVLTINDRFVPLLKKVRVGFPLPNDPKPERIGIYGLDKNGKAIYRASKQKEGWVYAETNVLGSFALMRDDVPPTLRAINLKPEAIFSDGDTLKFTFTDNLSGPKSYSAQTEKGWILVEYDAKNDLLFHAINAKTPRGKLTLNFKLDDEALNVATAKFEVVVK